MFDINNNVILFILVIGVLVLLVGFLAGYIMRKNASDKKLGNAEVQAKNMILDAENRVEVIKKEAVAEAREDTHKIRSDAERDARERRTEAQRFEKRLIQKEEALDKKIEGIEKKEENIAQKEQELVKKNAEMDEALNNQLYELEKISGYTIEEAKKDRKSNV